MDIKDTSLSVAAPPRKALVGVSVAFVGPDGAGKSTVVESLLSAWPGCTRFVFMGAGIDQANYSLPTSRWLTRRKRQRLEKMLEDPEVLPPARLLSNDQQTKISGGRIVKIVKLRGFVVLCDRHFIFEHRLESSESNELLSVRLHNWLLRRFYPRPDIVVFLDADAAFLQKRKMEWPVEHLEYQRQTIIKQRPLVGHFVTIDTTQPLAVVVDQVANEIVQYRSARDRN
jgi:thymidylate kinase